MHPLGLDPVLRKYAHGVGPYSSIVEVGAWCGAGTYQLAQGSGSLTDIHCYDRWKANGEEVAKMDAQGVEWRIGYDLEPLIRANLKEFGDRIHYHKGDIREAEFTERWDIGLYIDDASKNHIDRVLPRFEPRFGLGCILILMDYHDPACDEQRAFMEATGYEHVEDVVGAAVWRVR